MSLHGGRRFDNLGAELADAASDLLKRRRGQALSLHSAYFDGDPPSSG